MRRSSLIKPDMYELIRVDLAEREKLGMERYGNRLEPFSGKDLLKEAVEEAMDMLVYLRTLLYERDGK